MGEIVDAIQLQIDWCRKLGSPFSALILQSVARNVEDGPFHDLLQPWAGFSRENLTREAVPLRVLGGLHDLVLAGAAPSLAVLYPGGERYGEVSDLPTRLEEVCRVNHAELSRFILSPPQTNEVGRSACLLGGFLMVSAETGLPLRCLELGSSAGLNLAWDAFGYDLGKAGWRGPNDSTLTLRPLWSGAPLSNTPWPVVAERRGCDQRTVNLRDSTQARRLQAYVWADQQERLKRLRSAIEIALSMGVAVDEADAGAWAQAEVHPVDDSATVLFHSVVHQYLPTPTRERVDDAIRRAAIDATAMRPFAWLRMEPNAAGLHEVRLTLWPDGRDRLLARVHPHGAEIHWFGDAQT